MDARRWTGSAVVGAGLVLLALAAAPPTWRGPDAVATPRVPGAGRPEPGTAFARLVIPKLGLRWAVVEGVDPAALDTAPGHYPQTALPGQVGNFAVAGHRARGLFWDLDRLDPGDEVVVDYGPRTFTYAVTGERVVAPTAVDVLAPVPAAPSAAARSATLTLTTCEPKWDDTARLVVHAALRSTTDHPGEVPTT